MYGCFPALPVHANTYKFDRRRVDTPGTAVGRMNVLQSRQDKLAGLIGSRICHDLISPIGAVTNGLELMELAGLPRGPEAELVNQSAQSAAARIKYYRLAFGDSGPVGPSHSVRGEDVAGIIRGVFQSDRLAVHWHVTDEVPRTEAKAALLTLMCAEAALGAGGRIDITREGDLWTVNAAGSKLFLNAALWTLLSDETVRLPGSDISVPPSAVQFAVLPDVLRQLHRTMTVSHDETALKMTF